MENNSFLFHGKEIIIDTEESYNKWLNLWNSFDKEIANMVDADYNNFLKLFNALSNFEKSRESKE